MKSVIFALIFVFFSLYSPNSDSPPAPIHFGDSHVLVASTDGTISLVDMELETTLWSFKTGGPIYSFYQSSHMHTGAADTTYIDIGDDWNLYKYHRTTDTVERIGSADDFATRMKELSGNETTIIDVLDSSISVVFAYTGTVICALDTLIAGSAETCMSKLFRVNSGEKMFITRKDYTFLAYSRATGKLLWALNLAEFEANSLPVHRPTPLMPFDFVRAGWK